MTQRDRTEQDVLVDSPKVVEMIGISKNFGELKALDNVHFDLREGEILSLLGENGSGKTTLMNVLFGIYFPDAGMIKVRGTEVDIRNPQDARKLGIGMVHQHVKLIDVLTVAENIVLGLPGSALLDREALKEDIQAIADRYGFRLNPEEKIYNLSISEKQTVEIVKVLYRGADILILDEPTAVLTPQEIRQLFAVMREMRKDGKSLIIITHKLQEVLEISDRVTILRKGQLIDTVRSASATRSSLTEMMVGRSVDLGIECPPMETKDLCAEVKNLSYINVEGRAVLADINFDVYCGEILGIAGISGSGQKELCEAFVGLLNIKEGEIIFTAEDGEIINLVGMNPHDIISHGIHMAFVPEDRLGMGLVPSLDLVDNVMLKTYHEHQGPFVDRKTPSHLAAHLVDELNIDTPGIHTPVRRLSGGNVQKVLLGREISSHPRLLITAYPVRGLDINSSMTIYRLLNEQKKQGVAIIFVGEDLDVLLDISDRILVLCDGQVGGIVRPCDTTKEEIGYLMLGQPIPERN